MPESKFTAWTLVRALAIDLLIVAAYLALHCAIVKLKATSPGLGSVLFYASWPVLALAFYLSHRVLFRWLDDDDMSMIFNLTLTILICCAPVIFYAHTHPCRVPFL